MPAIKRIIRKGIKMVLSKREKAAEKRAERRAAAKAKEEAVGVMIRKYKMTEEEILKIWDEFYAKHPDGFMTKESFLATKEDKTYASAMFAVFDTDASGTLDINEYVHATSVHSLGTPREKLSWIFTAFDADGGGSIDVDELKDLVIGLFQLSGLPDDPDNLVECFQEIRNAVDVDGDGQITKEEFVEKGLQSKFINDLLLTKRVNRDDLENYDGTAVPISL